MADELRRAPARNRTMERRARWERWQARGRARVVHPSYGSVVVPHHSNLAALLCAAETWGCDWLTIRGAQVWRLREGEEYTNESERQRDEKPAGP